MTKLTDFIYFDKYNNDIIMINPNNIENFHFLIWDQPRNKYSIKYTENLYEYFGERYNLYKMGKHFEQAELKEMYQKMVLNEPTTVRQNRSQRILRKSVRLALRRQKISKILNR